MKLQLLLVTGILGVLAPLCACQAPQSDNSDAEPGSGSSSTSSISGLDVGIDTQATSAGPDTSDICAEASTSAQLVPTELLFVVDKSGSMKCNAPPTDNECKLPEKQDATLPSKWESTQAAFVGVDDPTTSADETGLFRTLLDSQGLRAGLIVFPTDSRCALLPAGDSTTNIDSLDSRQVQELDAALELMPDGETPLAGAATRGLDILRERVVSSKTRIKSYLVLMTDGAETCQPSALDDLRTYTKQALDYFGISTYVVGAPGSEKSRALLSEIAFLGGTAKKESCAHGGDEADVGDCHIDLTQSKDFSMDLSSAFEGIGQSTERQCNIEVPSDAFIDPDKVNVIYVDGDGEEEILLQDEADCADRADGWQYTDARKTNIVLCGDACQRLRDEPAAKARVVFGCQETLIR